MKRILKKSGDLKQLKVRRLEAQESPLAEAVVCPPISALSNVVASFEGLHQFAVESGSPTDLAFNDGMWGSNFAGDTTSSNAATWEDTAMGAPQAEGAGIDAGQIDDPEVEFDRITEHSALVPDGADFMAAGGLLAQNACVAAYIAPGSYC